MKVSKYRNVAVWKMSIVYLMFTRPFQFHGIHPIPSHRMPMP
jgi:hypothetical protein